MYEGVDLFRDFFFLEFFVYLKIERLSDLFLGYFFYIC